MEIMERKQQSVLAKTVPLWSLLIVALMIGSVIAPVYAQPTGPAGKSSIIQLYLVEKDSVTWTIVEGGAWGKMTYNKATGDFVFNGHLLDAGVSYTLINFARVVSEWPATINVLGSAATAIGDGEVHIAGNYPYASLGFDTTPVTGSDKGYKIWLVLSSDIVAGKLSGWTPTEYLFESALI